MKTAKIITEDPTVVQQVQQTGELPIEVNGVQMVLMTVDARQELQKVVFDDSELSGDEMMAVLADQVNDPEGMGAPGMDDYDKKYGHLFDDNNGKDQ